MDLRQLERDVMSLVVAGDDDAAIALMEENLPHAEASDDLEPLPFLYEELANCYSRQDRHQEAITAMDKSIETGYRGSPDGRALKAAFLLKAGRSDEADRLLHQVRKDTPEDIWLYNSAALAYQEVGDHERALEWSAQGLELALATGDKESIVSELLDVRIQNLQASGREPDDVDARALEFMDSRVEKLNRMTADLRSRLLSEDVAVAMAWFPRDDYHRALEMWPSLATEWGSVPHTDYCRDIQREMQRYKLSGAPLRWVAPLRIDAYLQWCDSKDEDPEEAKSRATYAATLAQSGEGIPWPPSRNEACWCGSSKKYKRCCGDLRPT
jgi:tetratricopeptide (TPR) repeat protein